jgi:bacteriorhodopsin
MGCDRDLRYFSLASPGVVDVRMYTLYIVDLALAHDDLPLSKQPRGARAFHHIAVAILFVSTITYFAMASDLGKTPIEVEFRFFTHGPDRDIFVRFVFLVISVSFFVPELTCACVRSAVGAICSMVHQRTAHRAVDTYDYRPMPV